MSNNITNIPEQFKNKYPWYGGIIFRITTEPNRFLKIEFASSVDLEDEEAGHDDAINIDILKVDNHGDFVEVDGGQMIINREESGYEGDIRNAVADCYQFMFDKKPNAGDLEPLTILS